MKKLYVTMLGLAAMAAGLTACHDDDVSSAPNVFEQDEVQYVTVAIGTPSAATRAGEDDPKEQEGYYGSGNYDGEKEPEYEAGKTSENKINNVYLVFYDEDGYRVGQSIDMNDGTSTDIPNTELGNATGNINRQRVILKAVTFKKNEKKPKYALAFVNPVLNTESLNSDAFVSLRGVEKFLLDNYYSQNHGFAMSNSVYYDENGNRVVATEIDEKMLTTDANLAQKLYDELTDGTSSTNKIDQNTNELLDDEGNSLGVKPLDIYVERYAVKVKFGWGEEAEISDLEIQHGTKTYTTETTSGDNDQQTTITTYNPVTYKLKFIPEAWSLNATESSVYAVKTYFNGNIDDPFAEAHTYAGINEVLTGTASPTYTWWNSNKDYRSYWAQSPAYYKDRYPNVSDDITDAKTGAAHPADAYPLYYYSYNEIVNNAEDYGDYDNVNATSRGFTADGQDFSFDLVKGKSEYLYAHENTLGYDALHNENPKAAVPAVVLVGHYKIEGEYNGSNKQSQEFEDNETFYVINKDRIYIGKEEIATRLISYDEYLYTSEKDINNLEASDVFGKNDLTLLTEYSEETDYIDIKHPNHDARKKAAETQTATEETPTVDHKVVDSRYVSLQLDAEKVAALAEQDKYLYYSIYSQEGGDVYKKIVKTLSPAPEKAKNEITVDEVNGRVLNWLPPVEAFNEGKAYFYIPITHLRFWVDSKQKYTEGDKAGQFIMPTSNDYDWTKARVGDFGLVRNHVYNISLDKISGLGTGIPDPDTPIVPPSDEEDYSLVTRINILNWAIVPTQHVEF